MQTYTVSEVAKMLKVRKGLVYELIYTNQMKAIRLSERRLRVTESQLAEFIRKNEN